MDLRELNQKLKELGVPDENYYLHGLYGSTNDEDKVALVQKVGKYSIEYECYFKERGEKHTVRIFYSEDEACQYILKILTNK